MANLISEARKLLENPYAYIEYLEQPTHASEEASTTAAIKASRRVLQNPYAHLNGSGEYEAEVPSKQVRPPARWRDDQIEAKARVLHARLWREREAHWASGVPTDPVDLLDPAVALRMLGYQFDYEEGLGQMRGSSGPIEVAGIIDSHAKIVRVGRQFSVPVRTFTIAHELGHAVLHPDLGALHRDKALDGASTPGDAVEVEANRFATFFLMPAKLVRVRFAELFQAEHFELTDDTAFALAGCSLSDLRRSHGTRRQLSRQLAGTERYNGRHFNPLHLQFRVSREPMAIRLEELGLVPG